MLCARFYKCVRKGASPTKRIQTEWLKGRGKQKTRQKHAKKTLLENKINAKNIITSATEATKHIKLLFYNNKKRARKAWSITRSAKSATQPTGFSIDKKSLGKWENDTFYTGKWKWWANARKAEEEESCHTDGPCFLFFLVWRVCWVCININASVKELGGRNKQNWRKKANEARERERERERGGWLKGLEWLKQK